MTTFLHIVGIQGVGKSLLAKNIIAGLRTNGASALSLLEAHQQSEYPTRKEIDDIRKFGVSMPYSANRFFDFLIVEHSCEKSLQDVSKNGDLIIRLERKS